MILVTGDRFEDFSSAVGAVPAAEMLRRLMCGEAETDMLIGPGVSDNDRMMMQILGRAGGLNVHYLPTDDRRAGRAVCHKHRVENQLISTPREVGADLFEADLLLDDRNEIMSDHVTGCHLQGMLLVEATRQMFIAVGETQYAHLGVPERAYVVFDRLDTTFEQFAFPIPTRIIQRVSSATAERGRVRFNASIEVHQIHGRVAVSDVIYTIFDAERISSKEADLARKAAAAQLSSLVEAVSPAPLSRDRLEAVS